MVTVRVDKDGDAMTKNPGDVVGSRRRSSRPTKSGDQPGQDVMTRRRDAVRVVGVWSELGALAAQCVAFCAGLVLSLMIGMVLRPRILDGPGGLLIATLIAGAGLLGAAVASQTLRDWLIRAASKDRNRVVSQIATEGARDR